MTVEITVTPSRNENNVSFSLDRALIPPGTGLSFPDAQSAQFHPLAHALFQIKGVRSVWILGNEIAVTKDEKMRWASLQSKIIETIQNSLNSG
ncbi:MAG: NifU N-terminal domain-containing protein [Nitrospinaceae bacterium]